MLGLRLGLVIQSKVGGGCLLTGNPKIIATITSGTFGGLGVGVHTLNPNVYVLGASNEQWRVYFGSYSFLELNANAIRSSLLWYTSNTVSYQLYQNTYLTGANSLIRDRLFFTTVVLPNATMTIQRACNWAVNP